jgi:site-specific recombinase XerD
MARPGNIHIPSLEKLVRGLLEKMGKAHYSDNTIHTHLVLIRPIQTNMDTIGVAEYTPEIGHQYLDQYFAMHHPKSSEKKNIINAFQFLKDHYEGKDIVKRSSSAFYNASLNHAIMALLNQLRDEGYTETTIKNYKLRLRPLQTYMASNHIQVYTSNVGNAYYKHVISTHKLGEVGKRELAVHVARLNDIVDGNPLLVNHHKSPPIVIPVEFRSVVDSFFNEPSIVSCSQVTINRRTTTLARFLIKCKTWGARSIKELTPDMVLIVCKQSSDFTGLYTIRQFLKYIALRNIVDNDLSTLVTIVPREKKVPSVYSVDEMKRLESTIDVSTVEGKRDIAVLMLADRLAIRSGDIARLKKSNLDFDRETITFEQQKTGTEISLPMIPEVKRALITYLNAFPTTGEYVFYCITAPFRHMTSQTVQSIVNRCFMRSGIDTSGKKHGPHSLRASVSSSMINDNIPYEAVRSVLGHTSSNSIRRYAKNDIEKLRRCAIPVPAPTGKFLEFLKGGDGN